jgi:hypothetical protein
METIILFALAIAGYIGYRIGRGRSCEFKERKGCLQGLHDSFNLNEKEKGVLRPILQRAAEVNMVSDVNALRDDIKKLENPMLEAVVDSSAGLMRMQGLPSKLARHYRDLLIAELDDIENQIQRVRKTDRTENRKWFKKQEAYGADRGASHTADFDEKSMRLTITFAKNPSPIRAYEILTNEMVALANGRLRNTAFLGVARIKYNVEAPRELAWEPMLDSQGCRIELHYRPSLRALIHPDGIYADTKL